ncbi:TIPIN [Mytilus edulis]|uniref:TIMELESS-interacting protein n=1 Tax=Mytilus edulis TaxID=6550 RepID=A0A8S3SUJ3_MYTED|nr:TIPIN [Mytilus edulis]
MNEAHDNYVRQILNQEDKENPKPSLGKNFWNLLKNKDMESVNLDMEDIFEEEAADDDFPSVGPLPDLPDGEEGTAGGEDEDNTDVMSKLKDLSKGAARKVVRKPMPKLDGQRLTGERGIPILPKVFEKVKFKGQGNEDKIGQIEKFVELSWKGNNHQMVILKKAKLVPTQTTFQHLTTEPLLEITPVSRVLQSVHVIHDCKEKCASLCGGKKERISPQAPPKRVEIPVYYQEPDESVISLRKLEIPTFKKDVRHPDDEDEDDKRKRSIDNTYSDVTCTYEEEERRRKRRRRRKKKNKRLRDEGNGEEEIENGDVLRSKLRSRRSQTRNFRASRDHEQDVIVSENVYYEQE